MALEYICSASALRSLPFHEMTMLSTSKPLPKKNSLGHEPVPGYCKNLTTTSNVQPCEGVPYVYRPGPPSTGSTRPTELGPVAVLRSIQL